MLLRLNVVLMLLARAAWGSSDAGARGLRGPAAPAVERRLESRHASAHLTYESPLSGASVVSWYSTLVPRHSSEDTYFAVQNHGFGYMGLQQVEERGRWFQGKVIFSIWDAGCHHIMDSDQCPEDQRAEVIECGQDSVCERFGGEGSGAKSYINFHEWDLEQEYGFAILAFQEGASKVRYEGYFHAPELGGWVLLSKLRVSLGGRPWAINGMASFVEQWAPRSPEDARWCRIGPMFVEAEGHPDAWTQVLEASFSHTSSAGEDTTHVHANVTNSGSQWGLGIGGNLVKGVYEGQRLSVQGGAAWPADMVRFSELRAAGQLPTGCEGGTCFWTGVHEWWAERWTKENFAISVALLCCLVLACCCCCCGCCGGLMKIFCPLQACGAPLLPNRQPSSLRLWLLPFKEGEKVEVWSRSKASWLEFTVEEIARKPVQVKGVGVLPPGSLRVSSATGGRWVASQEVYSIVRKSKAARFVPGEDVEVWSNSKKAFIQGTVQQVTRRQTTVDGCVLPPGSLGITIMPGKFKWVPAADVSSCVKKLIPAEKPSTPQGAPAFVQGEDVEVWSNSKKAFIQGTVQQVTQRQTTVDGCVLPPGSLGITIMPDKFKWVPAADVSSCVNKLIPAEKPSTPQGAPAFVQGEQPCTCPKGHAMLPSQAHDQGRCDGCKHPIGKGADITVCEACNHWFCTSCDAMGSDVPCPNGHRTQRLHAPVKGTCDTCSRKVGKGSTVLACKACDWWLCLGCHEAARAPGWQILSAGVYRPVSQADGRALEEALSAARGASADVQLSAGRYRVDVQQKTGLNLDSLRVDLRLVPSSAGPALEV